jgi:uncharacterized membrane protein YedE/YeeE
MFESPRMLLFGLLTGFAFGFLLQKGRVAKFQTVLGQLLLKDWTVVKVMATAVVVGSIGVYMLVGKGAAHLQIWPFQPAAQVLGAILFGIGLAVYGYCPGTGLAGSGEGSRDAMIGMLGMICGAGIYVVAYNSLERVALSLGDRKELTLPDVLGLNPWIVIAVFSGLVVAALILIEQYDFRKSGRTRSRKAQTSPREGWSLVH